MPRKRTADIKAEVWSDLREGRDIFESYLEDEAHKDRIYGLSESGKVYVNHAPHILDTLVHELLHRRYVRWGEKRVLQTASRIVASMSDAEIRQWYRRYRQVAKRTRTVRVED